MWRSLVILAIFGKWSLLRGFKSHHRYSITLLNKGEFYKFYKRYDLKMEINLSYFCDTRYEPLADWFVCLPSKLNTRLIG